EIENNGVSFYQRGEDIVSGMYSMDTGEFIFKITKGGASGGGGEKSSVEKGVRAVADVTPIVGGAWEMAEGVENGDYLQVSIGAGSLILDVATMGVGGTIIKGGLKKVIKEGAEELAEQGLKQAAKGSSVFSYITPKITKQMAGRGWTKELIHNTVNNPFTTRAATNRATGNAATAYFQKNGSYIVKDNVTNQVIQISNRLDPKWIPDATIINPYIPK